jgi:cephalosporin hydroxylase
MNINTEFEQQGNDEIKEMAKSKELAKLSNEWIQLAGTFKYGYHFKWCGRPIIQVPQDIVAMQELIWKVRPDLIIETGIAHGGSIIFSASMLAQLDMIDAIENGKKIDPRISNRKVIGIDIDIRAHNRLAIEAHPLSSRIQMIQGSSISTEVINLVRTEAEKYPCVMVCLDSNHTHDHVLAELEAYAPLTSKGSYCVVFDTIIEDIAKESLERPWGIGNSPKTAVWKYLKTNSNFKIDSSIHNKLQITVAPDGYLERIN